MSGQAGQAAATAYYCELIEEVLGMTSERLVRIVGLTARPELNGAVAAMTGERFGELEAGPIRYQVALQADGSKLKVRPQNLRAYLSPVEDMD